MNKKQFSYFIGIDVSKDSFNYHVIDQNFNTITHGKLDMDYDGFNYLTLSNIDELSITAKTRESIAKDIAKIKTKLKQILIIAFPEILHHYNIFTITFLNLLLHFPTAKHFKRASIYQIKQVIASSSNKGRTTNIDVKFIKKLARKSISSATQLTAINVAHLVKHLIFLNEQLDEINKVFIQQVNNSKKDDIDIIKSINGISDTTAAHFYY